MAEEITFNRLSNGTWARSFEVEGNTTIQLNREKAGVVSVRATIDGGEHEVPIAQFENGFTPNVIFQLNVPKGIEVTIISQTEVISAYKLVSE